MPLASEFPLLIAGSGAMACLFAAHLRRAGLPVAMLANWPEGLAVLRNQGVTLVECEGRESTYSVIASNNPADFRNVPYALVLVKAWQTERTAQQLAACLAPHGMALTLQNGLGNREWLTAHLGMERVALGVTTLGARLLGPGRVYPAGETRLAVETHPRLSPLLALLRQGGFIIEEVPRAEALLWGKLVINAAINPLTALLRVPNGELLRRPTARALMQAVAIESAQVANGLGISLPYADPIAAVENVARATANNRSSMLQDVERGAPTEIDAICGAIVRHGEQASVSTPLNRALWQLVTALQADPLPTPEPSSV